MSEVIKMKCEDCGGSVQLSEDRQIICCPFCGSKKMIIESDDVKIAQINAEADVQKEIVRENSKVKQEKIDAAIPIFMILISVIAGIILFISC